jgi:hypothetical protein
MKEELVPKYFLFLRAFASLRLCVKSKGAECR